MKKKLFTLFFILLSFCLADNLFAQDVTSSSSQKEAATAHLKNSVITIDGKSFDYRVLKHYSEDQLRNMSSVKRNQIHFIYTESYVVTDLSNCPSFRITDIDIAKFGTYRKESTPYIVEVGEQCRVQIELISRADLQKKLDELKK